MDDFLVGVMIFLFVIIIFSIPFVLYRLLCIAIWKHMKRKLDKHPEEAFYYTPRNVREAAFLNHYKKIAMQKGIKDDYLNEYVQDTQRNPQAAKRQRKEMKREATSQDELMREQQLYDMQRQQREFNDQQLRNMADNDRMNQMFNDQANQAMNDQMNQMNQMNNNNF